MLNETAFVKDGLKIMRIAYVVPGPMSKGPMGAAEVKRREGLLNEWAFEGTSVDVRERGGALVSAFDISDIEKTIQLGQDEPVSGERPTVKSIRALPIPEKKKMEKMKISQI